MSWYTVGEIVLWMLLAAALGVALGWMLRGLVAPGSRGGASDAPRAADGTDEPEGTRVEVIDTGVAGTVAEPVAPDEVAAPEPPAAGIAARTAGGLTPPHDDLTRIHGIGPKLAAALEALGITSFRQVARMSAEDIAELDEALGVFPGRIERDDWVGGARALHREVYGSDPVV
jgi:predicted flap endonuclease-1-like 5' DNA nuclease